MSAIDQNSFIPSQLCLAMFLPSDARSTGYLLGAAGMASENVPICSHLLSPICLLASGSIALINIPLYILSGLLGLVKGVIAGNFVASMVDFGHNTGRALISLLYVVMIVFYTALSLVIPEVVLSGYSRCLDSRYYQEETPIGKEDPAFKELVNASVQRETDLNEQITTQADDLAKNKRIIEKQTALIEELKRQGGDLSQNMQALQAERATLLATGGQQHERLRVLEGKILGLKDQLDENQNKLAIVFGEFTDLERVTTELRENLDRVTSERDQLVVDSVVLKILLAGQLRDVTESDGQRSITWYHQELNGPLILQPGDIVSTVTLLSALGRELRVKYSAFFDGILEAKKKTLMGSAQL